VTQGIIFRTVSELAKHFKMQRSKKEVSTIENKKSPPDSYREGVFYLVAHHTMRQPFFFFHA
jgi:hypothetical protein